MKLPFSRLVVALFTCACCAAAQAQSPVVPRYLGSLSAAGARSYITENWGAMEFSLSNPTAEAMEARVLTSYADAPGRQYGRDVWVPAQATLWSWYCIGPPPARPEHNRLEFKTYLFDRTGGQEHLLRSADGQPQHSHLARFERREPGTTVMQDADIADASQAALSPRDEARADEARDLVRILRHQRGLSERVTWLRQRQLPPAALALDGIDHFVLASDRIAEDHAGQRALRTWLHRGGSLWVLLDRVQVETVAALLGDALDLQVVDRTSLVKIEVQSGPDHPGRTPAEVRELEEPVDFVRVLAPRQRVLYTVDGWPAAFMMDVGRGRVLFTTLGARGWMRPRTERDPKSPYREFPNLSVPLVPLEFLAVELHPGAERAPVSADDLRAFVTEEISYSVVGRDTVFVVFSSFFLLLVGVFALLGLRGLLEHMSWLGPALALGATGIFVGLGAQSRNAVPPTVALAQLVDAAPGLAEVETGGFLGVYRPSDDDTVVGAEQGGQFDLDIAGLEGRVHRRVQTDLDRWHWENLELPAGIRVGPFQHTAKLQEPLTASARFGPQGLEGRVGAGGLGQLEDALLSTAGHERLALRISADGTFTATSDDALPPGRLIAGALLSDRQRARQRLYEKLLAEPLPRYLANRPYVLAWGEPVPTHFTLAPDARINGSALFAIPLRLERSAPGTRVTVPAALVDARRVTDDGRSYRPATEARSATNSRLRFQLPEAVLPLRVDGARFTMRIQAPKREVAVSGFAAGKAVALQRFATPTGAQQVEITDAALLAPDERGAIYLSVGVGESAAGAAEPEPWRLESVGLEIRGLTQ